mmetsp:Transcript_44728/g.106017  ORF Transcript_44728/g.106017 Transcript_44728/m.106017 type:complete len:285 (-) Transcript_44728:97-951(-)
MQLRTMWRHLDSTRRKKSLREASWASTTWRFEESARADSRAARWRRSRRMSRLCTSGSTRSESSRVLAAPSSSLSSPLPPSDPLSCLSGRATKPWSIFSIRSSSSGISMMLSSSCAVRCRFLRAMCARLSSGYCGSKPPDAASAVSKRPCSSLTFSTRSRHLATSSSPARASSAWRPVSRAICTSTAPRCASYSARIFRSRDTSCGPESAPLTSLTAASRACSASKASSSTTSSRSTDFLPLLKKENFQREGAGAAAGGGSDGFCRGGRAGGALDIGLLADRHR